MLLPLKDNNPLKYIRFQYITVAMIGVCIAVFVYQASLGGRADRAFIFGFGAIPAVVFGSIDLPAELLHVPAVVSLLTSMFLHGGFMHLFGNLLFLWVLGDNVEDALGHKRFIIFYLACGFIAALAHAIAEPTSQLPMIGASGAISGVIGAYLMVHPKARIKTLVGYLILSLPAWVVLGLWIGLQFFSASAATGSEGGGVAWWAHIGGFIAGAILIVPMRRKGLALFDRDKKRFELWLGTEKAPKRPRKRSSRILTSGDKRKTPWGSWRK